MSVRKAEAGDIPALVEMGRRFHEAKQDAYPFDADSTAEFFASLIPGGGVFISPGGFIAGAIAGAPSNKEYLTAYEVFWWSEDKSGSALLRAFEQWAKDSGCADVKVSHPAPERGVNAILRRKGYADAEISMEKTLCA